MATAPSYIPLRDDAGLKSISKNERDFVRQCALHQHTPLRLDGRGPRQSRNTRLVLTRYATGGSAATLQWGTGTRVNVSCTGQVVPPTDRPNEGMVAVSVEFSPSASTAFRLTQPVTNQGAARSAAGGTADEAQKLETNRILRALERLLSSCLDAEALVVTPGQWVWKLTLTVVVVDAAAGNLMDACWMATLAALQHYRQPHTEARSVPNENDGASQSDKHNPLAPVLVSLDAKEGTPLPLHQVPFAVTFALIADEVDASRSKVVFLQDPSLQEEMIAAGHFTYALNVHQEVCLVDFGGGAEINLVLIRDVHDAAAKQVGILAQALQTTLQDADAQAVQQRLQNLKQQGLAPPPAVEEMADNTDDNVDLPPLPEGDIRSPDDLKMEEEYRKQALDYNLGHVAQPLADETTKKKKESKGTSALLASLLQTASKAEVEEKERASIEAAATSASPTEESTVPATGEPPQTTSSTKLSRKLDMDSDDEEETTMQLQSEFATAPAPDPPQERPAPKAPEAASPANINDDDDDVDDLAAAIKTKKKKKKKK